MNKTAVITGLFCVNLTICVVAYIQTKNVAYTTGIFGWMAAVAAMVRAGD